MSESIVTKQPAVQSNPFQKHIAEHVSAGTVAIESERAIAEAQGKLIIAKRFPRDQAVAYANIIDACKRPGLAEEACYSFPRGGEVVSGPAIRLAEMLAANWGNVDYGIRELSRKEGVSEMEAYCWDLETNTMSSQKFTVRHIRDRRGGGVALTDEREIYELTANMGARRLRARILAILPADLVQAAVDQCSKTLANGGDVPMADRIRKMVLAFKVLGVPAVLIEKRLNHPIDAVTGEELADLTKIHNSLRDGMSGVDSWFGDAPLEPDPAATKGAAGAVNAAKNTSSKSDAVQGDPLPEGAAPVEQAATEERAPSRPRRGQAVKPDEAKPAENPAPAATEQPAAKPAPEKIAEPLPPGAAPVPDKPRAFLQDGERITVEVEVVDLVTGNSKVGKELVPTVQADVKGGFTGQVRHSGGATLNAAGIAVENPPWAKGAKVRLELLGKKSTSTTGPNVNKVLVWVQAISAIEGAQGQIPVEEA